MASVHQPLSQSPLTLNQLDIAQTIAVCREKLEGIRLKIRLLRIQKRLTEKELENDVQALELLIEGNAWRVRLHELDAAQTTLNTTTCKNVQQNEYSVFDADSYISSFGNIYQAFGTDADASSFIPDSDNSSFSFMEGFENEWGIRSTSSSSTDILTASNNSFVSEFESMTDSLFSQGNSAIRKMPQRISSFNQVENLNNQSALGVQAEPNAQNDVDTPRAGWNRAATNEEGERQMTELTNSSGILSQLSENLTINDHRHNSDLPPTSTGIPQEISLPLIDPHQKRTGKNEATHSNSLRILKPKSAQQIYADQLGNCVSKPLTVITPRKQRIQKSVGIAETDKTATPKQRKPKGAYQDIELKQQTAQTRLRGVCSRCHRYRERCPLNPLDPEGPCVTCLNAKSSLVCIREKFSKLSLCRDQSTPWPAWTKRYDDMEARNISGWASDEVKTIRVSHRVQNASYTLRVRKFFPAPGDMLYETWYDTKTGTFKRHHMEPYAVVDMEELWHEMQRYIVTHIARFIISIVGSGDDMIWSTYVMAGKRCLDNSNGVRDKEKALLGKALQLWVASRMASLPEDVCGSEQITQLVEDVDSPYCGTRPLPPVIYAQEETILLGQIQRPLQAQILAELDALMKTNRKTNWFTIYLTLFILSHSCTLTTRRDAEFARQMNLKTKFANPEAIHDNHNGILQLIKSFHKENNGAAPFNMALSPSQHQELATSTNLKQDELQFVQQTAIWASQRGHIFEKVKRHRDTAHDFFFIAQLYDQRWNAPVTDINE